MTIEIIKARSEHKDHILAACQQTFAEHRARQPFTFPQNSFKVILRPAIDGAFSGEKGQPLRESPNIFVALNAGEFVGYVILSRWSDKTPLPVHYVNIDDIYVDPNHRSKGVADALLSHVKILCDDNDWGDLNATVWYGNHASDALFRKQGFAVLNTAFRYGPDRQAIDYPAPQGHNWGRFLNISAWIIAGLAGVITYLLLQ